MRFQQEKIKKELIYLWTGELAAVVSFWSCLFMLKRSLSMVDIFKVWVTDTKVMILILYPLIILSFILIQGSAYWFILLRRLSSPCLWWKYVGKIYGILKITDAFLLCMWFPILLLNYNGIIVTALSFFIWLFALIEWINYYVVRLSYSYNPLVLIGHLKNRTLKKSRIAREIAKR